MAETPAPDAEQAPAGAETPADETPEAGTPAVGAEPALGTAPPPGGDLMGVPLPLLLSGGLAALIVGGIFVARRVWFRRQRYR
jgi:hypothetical protein